MLFIWRIEFITLILQSHSEDDKGQHMSKVFSVVSGKKTGVYIFILGQIICKHNFLSQIHLNTSYVICSTLIPPCTFFLVIHGRKGG